MYLFKQSTQSRHHYFIQFYLWLLDIKIKHVEQIYVQKKPKKKHAHSNLFAQRNESRQKNAVHVLGGNPKKPEIQDADIQYTTR